MTEPEYVAAVLAAYVALPDTACRPRPADRTLAHQLFAEGVPLALVLDALLLAHARRHLHPDPPPQPVRSLHYVLPVIRELASIDPAVLTCLHHSLHQHHNAHTAPTQHPPTTPTST
jgi:hypothetical protein